jgi:DNA-binding transcriptional MerR regulator
MKPVMLGPRELARATGVSTDTLRHYERLGLLPTVHRTGAGYRRYAPPAIARVQMIQRALVIGFSLGDLKRVLAVRDGGGAPCRSVRALVGQRLVELAERIEHLRALRDDLTALVAEWDVTLEGTPDGARAHLLDGLRSFGGDGEKLTRRTRRPGGSTQDRSTSRQRGSAKS